MTPKTYKPPPKKPFKIPTYKKPDYSGIKSKIDTLKANPTSQYNPGWNLAIDINNMIIACEAVAKSALERRESRGGHTRLDFPEALTNFIFGRCLNFFTKFSTCLTEKLFSIIFLTNKLGLFTPTKVLA